MRETLVSVIQTLCGLFENKTELRGFSDWDKFIGCIMALEKIANSIQDSSEESEVVNNG